jgi:hypothetical protein
VIDLDLAIWAVDPHRGTVSWRIDQPTVGSRYLVTAGLDSMTSYDGRTGATASQAGIQLSGIIYSYVSDSRFVIGHSSGLAAYRLPSLAPLWHVATDPQENRLQPDCVRVLCSTDPSQCGASAEGFSACAVARLVQPARRPGEGIPLPAGPAPVTAGYR